MKLDWLVYWNPYTSMYVRYICSENAMEMYQRLNVVERGFAPRRDEIFKADWEKEK